jgi:hypothetical protein
VWPTAVPQKAALAHYGWNTVIEGLWHGVPMALWPRYAEQHLNAFALGATVDVTKLEHAVWVLMGEGGEEGEGEGPGDDGSMQEGCRRRRVVVTDVEAALQ